MKEKNNMALLQTKTSSVKNDFTGYFEAGIIKVEDRSDQYDWADVWIDVHFNLKGSQYPQVHSIKGSFDKEADGTVKVNKMVRQFNYFKDAIGYEGGINTMGTWEDEEGGVIDNIETSLNNHINNMNGSDNPMLEPPFDFYIYLYKEAPKKAGAKVYKRVLGKICSNDAKGKAELTSYVTYMQQKQYIKEASDEDVANTTTSTTTSASGDDLPF
tara:strand:- start:107 stop:748 length:642 start_codon:yes stop_codon:yes gene_type:complete